EPGDRAETCNEERTRGITIRAKRKRDIGLGIYFVLAANRPRGRDDGLDDLHLAKHEVIIDPIARGRVGAECDRASSSLHTLQALPELLGDKGHDRVQESKRRLEHVREN